jgi:hypothetical protein
MKADRTSQRTRSCGHGARLGAAVLVLYLLFLVLVLAAVPDVGNVSAVAGLEWRPGMCGPCWWAR